jgi:GNAT superfamily N-acetyltransferase
VAVNHTEFTPLNQDGYSHARGLLGRAFADYNLMVYCQPDERRRLAAATTVYGALMHDCHRLGEVQLAGDRRGVTCWIPPGVGIAGLWRQIRAGMLAVPFFFGLAGFRRLLAYGNAGDQLHHQCAPMPHWHLSLVAVEPAHQGHGVGGALMQPMLDRADSERLPCYLDTHQDRNVRFYQRHGFEVVHRVELPGHPLPLYGMLREPR